ncbi:MAG: amino acid permease, partial [Bacillota bacterium]|nr:amino acid permease [Bacillota bacterium]
AATNGMGALVTFLVLMIFCMTKFLEGAWIIIIVTPAFLWLITRIYSHYEHVANELRLDLSIPIPQKESLIIVPVAGIHRVVASTITHAKTLSPNVVAFYVAFSEEDAMRMEKKWEEWNPDVRLVSFVSRYRTVTKPLIAFIERINNHVHEKQMVIVLLPQFIPKKTWHRLLHNQSAFWIRSKLLARQDVIIATVPYHLHS